MNKITVDKDVPLPEGAGMRGSAKYPWADMAVGDSFFTVTPAEVVSGAIAVRRRKHKERHASRTVTENGVKGTRVWRIE